MIKMLTIKEVAKETNLSEYAIRSGVNSGIYPAMRVCGNPRGKILINIEMFKEILNKISAANVTDSLHVEEGLRKIPE